ncbi:DNA repair protein RecO [Hartmannibacter diazotrophicus]|uniref:DNA repair protein RecO n=1 Tax=Hartmannibacter diazotrophicus TaxID=1482074 RepID=A0A2C9D830_9HYPH|nr:DNA repair protein RecO [Hartmannibacter diazotrophicus]SON56288.1 DNA repair protein RecO [Hartmannibacter diazotrophicus]
MEWSGEGIVLGTRAHGETSAILEVMTPDRGRHMGLVRGGRSRRHQAMLQAGNTLALTWRARLESHLGLFTVEPLVSRAARLIDAPAGVLGLQTIAAHLRYLPERDPHPGLYEALSIILDHMDDAIGAARLLVRFELALLDELGFGLDLSKCAANGQTHDLAWVSPKTGRAVSREAGLPYAPKLLALPVFLSEREADVSVDDLQAALQLTGYFLIRHLAEPRGQPLSPARDQFLGRLRVVPAA